MDYLWTPWRYRYMAEAAGQQTGCIFCSALEKKDDAETLIVFRGKKNFILLNRYPYTSGHVMIVPYAHIPDLKDCDAETLAEMMLLAQRATRISGTAKTVKPPPVDYQVIPLPKMDGSPAWIRFAYVYPSTM